MWIKICGITTIDDALMVADAGASAIGLNFYPPSPRSVPTDTATQIADAVKDRLEIVGVFVDFSPEQVAQIVRTVGLNTVQLHGNESADDVVRLDDLLPDQQLIRAIRIGRDATPLKAAAESLHDLPLAALLVDAFVPDQLGGTGRTVAPELLVDHQHVTEKLILAGGLRPDNVRSAVQQVRPWGVDTASGVESGPGRKSATMVHDFIAACQVVG